MVKKQNKEDNQEVSPRLAQTAPVANRMHS